MPILLTSEDVNEVFDDVAFMEERFSDVQALLLGHGPAPGLETKYPLPSSHCRLTVRPYAPGPFGLCLVVRLGPAPPRSAAAGVELLIADDDGSLLGIADADTLDGWRAAIPSGLAARYLAPPSPRSLALLGDGEWAWSSLVVLHHALPSLDEFHIVGRDPSRARELAAAVARRTGLTVHASDDVRAAVRRADIVAVTGGHRTIPVEWLAAGALLIDQAAAPTEPAPAVRRITLSPGDDYGTADVPHGPMPLAEIVAGRALPRGAGHDVVHYQGGELSGWSAMAATAGLGQAWHRDVGTPVRLGGGSR
ncbi:hypothetical protein [Streptomyces niveus]|uniref:hypothetical protein n=1 Tax=Streptomyces niveus TaxID=193462 RepID=UPI003628712E